MGKECNAGQTVSDWDGEEENSAPKPLALIPPPQQWKTSYKQRHLDSKLNSLLPRIMPGTKRLELVSLAQQELNKAIKDIPQQNTID